LKVFKDEVINCTVFTLVGHITCSHAVCYVERFLRASSLNRKQRFTGSALTYEILSQYVCFKMSSFVC